jgi:hypothetical protein
MSADNFIEMLMNGSQEQRRLFLRVLALGPLANHHTEQEHQDLRVALSELDQHLREIEGDET